MTSIEKLATLYEICVDISAEPFLKLNFLTQSFLKWIKFFIEIDREKLDFICSKNKSQQENYVSIYF